MSRSRARRRGRRFVGPRQSQATLLLSSFFVGVLLEWLRSQPVNEHWTVRSDMLAILVAAWVSVSLSAWWPESGSRAIPRTAALLLGALFLGTLVGQALLNQP